MNIRRRWLVVLAAVALAALIAAIASGAVEQRKSVAMKLPGSSTTTTETSESTVPTEELQYAVATPYLQPGPTTSTTAMSLPNQPPASTPASDTGTKGGSPAPAGQSPVPTPTTASAKPSAPTPSPAPAVAPTTSGSSAARFSDSFSGGIGSWVNVSNGGGGVQIGSDGGNSVYEQWTSTSNSRMYNRTLSRASFTNPTITVRARTLAQLASNPSEDFSDSFVWSRVDANNFYAVQCYPGGWDVGKVSNGSFISLGWGNGKRCPIGTWHTYKIQQNATSFSVWIDGTLVKSYTDSAPLNTGVIGLGAVTSRVQWDDVTVS